MKLFNNRFKSFTLVELIIVIAIIAVLAVISVMTISEWIGKSRDTRRLGDLTQIEKGIELGYVKNNSYPMPDSYATVQLSGAGTTVSYQGYFGDGAVSKTALKSTPKDPLDDSNYLYSVSSDQSKYQIMAFLESNKKITAYNQTELLAADYSKRYPSTKGNNVGILLISGTNQPINETTGTVDINTLQTNVNMIISDTNQTNGTGSSLYGIMQSMNKGGYSFSEPSNCPSGFIPVPGNKDFNQPGFCVAKYEMSYTDADTPNTCDGTCPSAENTANFTDWNTVAYTGIKVPVSMEGKYPIAKITQSQAISSCASMGSGYHLITNNEWMTVARNIESVSSNWSSGSVGKGYLTNGVSNDATLGCGGATNTKGIYTSLTRNWATKTGGGFGSGACDAKRQHKLDNGQIIWDLAGNIWELVNGGNTLDGTNYAKFNGNACSSAATNAWKWYSFTNNSLDTSPQCSFINGYTYNSFGPKTQGLNAGNGIGRIYSYDNSATYTDRVLLRGGNSNGGSDGGVFALSLDRGSTTATRSVGFRCAYTK